MIVCQCNVITSKHIREAVGHLMVEGDIAQLGLSC